jgi:hypothetical protein
VLGALDEGDGQRRQRGPGQPLALLERVQRRRALVAGPEESLARQQGQHASVTTSQASGRREEPVDRGVDRGLERRTALRRRGTAEAQAGTAVDQQRARPQPREQDGAERRHRGLEQVAGAAHHGAEQTLKPPVRPIGVVALGRRRHPRLHAVECHLHGPAALVESELRTRRLGDGRALTTPPEPLRARPELILRPNGGARIGECSETVAGR